MAADDMPPLTIDVPAALELFRKLGARIRTNEGGTMKERESFAVVSRAGICSSIEGNAPCGRPAVVLIKRVFRCAQHAEAMLEELRAQARDLRAALLAVAREERGSRKVERKKPEGPCVCGHPYKDHDVWAYRRGRVYNGCDASADCVCDDYAADSDTQDDEQGKER